MNGTNKVYHIYSVLTRFITSYSILPIYRTYLKQGNMQQFL